MTRKLATAALPIAAAALFVGAVLLVGPHVPSANGASGKACDTPAAEKGNIDCGPGFPACDHPWPCADGSEWPEGLEGPFGFDYRNVEPVTVKSGDIELHGWVALPEVPAGTKVPVTLTISPYIGICLSRIDIVLELGQCLPTPDQQAWWDEEPMFGVPPKPYPTPSEAFGVPPINLVRDGYAHAVFSSRGTGISGGCYDLYGSNDDEDAAAIIEYLANQSWSNGRVAIGGISASSWTASAAAVTGTPSLKTFALAGIVSDPYVWQYSPQGAMAPWFGAFSASQLWMNAWVPHMGGGPGYGLESIARVPERMCDEARAYILGSNSIDDDRTFKEWDDVRLTDRFGDVTAAALIVEGFDDVYQAYGDDLMWSGMPGPKRQITGPTGHWWPGDAIRDIDPRPGDHGWEDVLGEWLAFWLKGQGPMPYGLNTVHYRDSSSRELPAGDGVWRQSDSWPPEEAHEEILYLAGTALAVSPGSGTRTFMPVPADWFDAADGPRYVKLPYNLWAALCDPTGLWPSSLAYFSPPVEEDVVLAGSAYAYLRLSSNLPGGIFTMALWDIPPDYSCSSTEPPLVQVPIFASADLRFHEGNFVGKDFPTDQTTHVRLDFWDIAYEVKAGHTLAVVLFGSEVNWQLLRAGQPYHPLVTVSSDGGAEASHIVLPILEGTLGGAAPTLDYPPRPFGLEWDRP